MRLALCSCSIKVPPLQYRALTRKDECLPLGTGGEPFFLDFLARGHIVQIVFQHDKYFLSIGVGACAPIFLPLMPVDVADGVVQSSHDHTLDRPPEADVRIDITFHRLLDIVAGELERHDIFFGAVGGGDDEPVKVDQLCGITHLPCEVETQTAVGDGDAESGVVAGGDGGEVDIDVNVHNFSPLFLVRGGACAPLGGYSSQVS